MIGSNRILKAEATTHPLGNPNLQPEKEKALRRDYIERALELLKHEIHESTVFSVN